MSTSAPTPGYRPGEPVYRRVTIALFLAGLATFALLYAPQPLLPLLVRDFAVTETQSTLSVSITTLGLGIALLIAGPGTEVLGRTPLMHTSLFLSSAVGLACAFAPSWTTLLILRGLQGAALAGLPAVATAYLREEVHPSAAARATGLYIGGTALGGMSGRLISGAVADVLGWHAAMAALGALGLACAVAVRLLLPPSQHFHPRPARASDVLITAVQALKDPALLALYGISGTLMGGFVAVYNAMGFRLADAPYRLPLSLASLVFLSYALGSFSSSWAGRLADRFGHRAVVPGSLILALVGLLLTLPSPLPLIVLGLALLTAGFFAAHGVASSWVAARAALGGGGAGQAASLYLFAYYLGSSVFGSLAGAAWTSGRWPGVAAMVGALWTCALALSIVLRRTPRLG